MLRDTVWALQATAASDGRVLLFDTALFQGGGGVVSPAAAQQVAAPGATLVGLEWLTGAQTRSLFCS
jgi:hypothetical protein